MGSLTHQRPDARSTSPTTASPTRTPARTAATTPRPRSTRSRKSACRPRTSRPSTAAAPARRFRSSHAAARKDFHGTAAFYKRDDKWNGNEFAAQAAVRPRRHRAVRSATLRLRQHGVDDRRSGAHPGHRLQQGPEQAVLLLVTGPPVAHRPGHAEPAPHADRARARR